MGPVSPRDALTRAEDRLAGCGRHLIDASRSLGQQRELLSTAVVLLRSIWNILNNMDKSDAGIATWFRRLSDTAKQDPLLNYFTVERSLFLKEGVDTIKGVRLHARPGARAEVGPEGFTFRWTTPVKGPQEVRVPRPANVRSSFMGDQSGGMGYFIELPDGTLEKRYVQVPPECAQVTLFYPHAPLVHLGRQLYTREADVLIGLFHAFWVQACKELREYIAPVGADR